MVALTEISGIQLGRAVMVILACYALGCLTLGYYLVLFSKGKDVRLSGSGSVGASNVGRALGLWGFGLTAAGDLIKGAVAVWATERVTASDGLKIVAMLAVVVGHIWPLQLRFHGGKGVATSTGALIFLNPWSTGGLFLLFGVGLAVLRNTVLAAMAAFSILPLLSGFIGQPILQTVGFAVLAALLLFAHRQNVREELTRLAVHRRSDGKTRRSTGSQEPQPKSEIRIPKSEARQK